ncbi:tim complex component tim54 [Grosmannia clavigera kw1407]|uniref:Mitochondrial import inner membrane translocase subunit TIM54 n=1 Tax=Grosmannia clavigera (strain kw1407 / UAMH 11150) TaxID=655863 RepID=F0XL40_GROCL|nr:tim complex component tim54 [Grosmannia clavigera kw1407]EFX01673.1 tim complex component tim54 [Grosmannia clavigera kw1407]
MPRRITVYLEAPPGDGLRSAQDHFSQYIKPILCKSGLDWDFVVGRQQGDVRAVVAERVRRARRVVEKDLGNPIAQDAPTAGDAIEEIRRRNGIPDYEGVKGDIIVGRHTWKEYVRGLHEGWLGPLAPPIEPTPMREAETAAVKLPSAEETEAANGSAVEGKPKQPRQLQPYNIPEQYPSSSLPRFIPAELGPSVPISFPHILGFFNTPTRMYRYLNRRSLADDIGRDVASICLASYREYREDTDGYEQAAVLIHEEKNWVKTVWKCAEDDKCKGTREGGNKAHTDLPLSHSKEKIWASPIVLDSRIAARMRRFAIDPEAEQRARQITVPEEQVEGWTKGKLRQLVRWGVRAWKGDQRVINVGDLDATN